MRFEQALDLLRALERENVRYVLIGSMAMAAQGLIRATEDIDLFVDPSPANIESIRRALRSVFDDPSIDEITAKDMAGAYPVVRYGPPDTDFTIDLVPRLGDVFAYDDIEFEEIRVGDVLVRVATPRMLVRMKGDTVRPQDRLDAASLRERFGIEEQG